MLAMVVLAFGSVLMSISPNLSMLLVIRFLVGLGHGVFIAVASEAATKLVDQKRSGRALSVVWVRAYTTTGSPLNHGGLRISAMLVVKGLGARGCWSQFSSLLACVGSMPEFGTRCGNRPLSTT